MTRDQSDTERSHFSKRHLPTYLLSATLAFALLTHSGAVSPTPAYARTAQIDLVRGNPDTSSTTDSSSPIVLDASGGVAAWSAEASMGISPLPWNRDWGLLQEVVDGAEPEALYLEQPQVGGSSKSIYDGPRKLSDGISETGTNKAFQLEAKADSLPDGATVTDIAVPFPGTTEVIGLELRSTSTGLKITRKYNPNPKDPSSVERPPEVFEVRNFDPSQRTRFTFTFADFGDVRRFIVTNGSDRQEEQPGLHRDFFARVKPSSK